MACSVSLILTTWDLTKTPLVFMVCITSYFIVGNGIFVSNKFGKNFPLEVCSLLQFWGSNSTVFSTNSNMVSRELRYKNLNS